MIGNLPSITQSNIKIDQIRHSPIFIVIVEYRAVNGSDVRLKIFFHISTCNYLIENG